MAEKVAIINEKLGEDLWKGVHNQATHVFKVYLTNVSVLTTHTVKADVAEIATGNGYSGPLTVAVTLSRTGGVTKIIAADPTTITAAGGTIGPFRGVVLYNDTPTSPADPIIASWDYGSSITLQASETFPIDFSATNGIYQLTASAAP